MSPLKLTACSWTPQWDCGPDPWSTGRWWSPQHQSSPLDPPLCQCHRPTTTASMKRLVLISQCRTRNVVRKVRYLQMCGYLGQRSPGDETQVSGAWSWMLCFGLKLLPQLVKVELLLAESQSFPIPLENTRTRCFQVKVNIQMLPSSGCFPKRTRSCVFHTSNFLLTLKVTTFMPRAVV